MRRTKKETKQDTENDEKTPLLSLRCAHAQRR